jgi:hypothetical protein
MKTTFLNGDKAFKERGLRHLESRKADINVFMKADDLENTGELGSFFDYGLHFDYVEIYGKKKNDYFRYQLSYGGPSDELRFYADGDIDYVFLDWFTGVGFSVTGEDWAEWLENWFKDCGLMNFHEEREKYDYYEILSSIEL